MNLVLWRHAEAEPGAPEEARKLTPKGAKQAHRVANWLRVRLPDSAKIYSSPARHAQQTAFALAAAMHSKVKILEELGPSATAAQVLDAIQSSRGQGTIVVVGHQPTLGQVAGHVLSDHASSWTIRKGGLVWIGHRRSDGDDKPALRAAMSPDLV